MTSLSKPYDLAGPMLMMFCTPFISLCSLWSQVCACLRPCVLHSSFCQLIQRDLPVSLLHLLAARCCYSLAARRDLCDLSPFLHFAQLCLILFSCAASQHAQHRAAQGTLLSEVVTVLPLRVCFLCTLVPASERLCMSITIAWFARSSLQTLSSSLR
jgi:hypothetical protein